MKKALIALVCVAGLSACGSAQQPGETSGEAVGDQLDEAAAQSSPAAREVLEDAADEAREHPSLPQVDKPGSFAQDAMEKASKAEAPAVTGESSPAGK